MQKASSISVIICAHTEERWNDLVEAVASVDQQALPPGEIIVVVDHNPRLLKRVQENMPNVVAVENKETRGLSGARNSGIAVALNSIIAFLDDDAVAMPEWLSLFSEAFTDRSMLGTGGAVLPLWEENKPTWLPEEFYWVIGCSYRGMPQTIAPIRNFIGANMALRRIVFDTIGGFRDEFARVGKSLNTCDETELCIRAHKHWPESTILYQPRAYVFHRVPKKRTSWRYFCSRCYAEGQSKAVVTRYVGVKDGLASERAYILLTLLQGVKHALADVLFRHDRTGFIHASTMVIGLALTCSGYMVECIFPRNL
jgi:GT2 family glycosyltransferase